MPYRITLGSAAVVAGLAMAALLPAGPATAVTINPFASIIGKWAGSGIMTMRDGTRERIACEAEHSGNALQLRLVIRCLSGERDIRMVARLSSNAGRLLGFWEEKYFSAAGAISGIATENKISFTVSGNVNGAMEVAYSKTRQQVSIRTRDVPLKSLEIDMKRR
ncbi:MAG: hypothetical protein BroJett030_10220 [Alphaproteobacteria bacterium]|nr:MAG: hypothetical protein BroJett030_10220 [Alphaproteobacteria bacterium]